MAKSKKSGKTSKVDENGSEILKDAENTARDISENVENIVEDATAKQEVVSEDGAEPEASVAETEDAETDAASQVPEDEVGRETEPVSEDTFDGEAVEDKPEDAQAVEDTTSDADADQSTPDAEPEEPEQPSTSEASEGETDQDAEPVHEETTNADQKDAKHPDGETAEAVEAEAMPAEDVLDTPEDIKPEPEVAELEPAERAPEPEPKIIRETQVVKGSMWPGLFGGLIAAVIGFVAGRGEMLDNYLPESMQRPAVDVSAIDAVTQETAALAAQTEAQAARIDALEAEPATPAGVGSEAVQSLAARIEALEAAPPLVGGDDAAGGSEALAAASVEIAALAERVTALEERPVVEESAGASEEALSALSSVAALEAALDEQAARLAELTAAAEVAEANAESEAARILARAALARVEVAVDSGEPFDTALSALEEVSPAEVPEPLRSAAETGVPTMVELQAGFPEAARNGLAAARAEDPGSEVSGVTGFIRRQLNVRSTVPREGTDPDAVLSRAEAAVRAGDLDTALTEMEALPDAARAEMNDWLEAASARKAAQDAARELADSLSSN